MTGVVEPVFRPSKVGAATRFTKMNQLLRSISCEESRADTCLTGHAQKVYPRSPKRSPSPRSQPTLRPAETLTDLDNPLKILQAEACQEFVKGILFFKKD